MRIFTLSAVTLSLVLAAATPSYAMASRNENQANVVVNQAAPKPMAAPAPQRPTPWPGNRGQEGTAQQDVAAPQTVTSSETQVINPDGSVVSGVSKGSEGSGEMPDNTGMVPGSPPIPNGGKPLYLGPPATIDNPTPTQVPTDPAYLGPPAYIGNVPGPTAPPPGYLGSPGYKGQQPEHKRCNPDVYLGRKVRVKGDVAQTNDIDPRTLKQPYRILFPDSMMTEDYSPNRLNLIIDKTTHMVLEATCG